MSEYFSEEAIHPARQVHPLRDLRQELPGPGESCGFPKRQRNPTGL